jgi:uncharacterized protein YcgL (UPF0745 family)
MALVLSCTRKKERLCSFYRMAKRTPLFLLGAQKEPKNRKLEALILIT